MADDYQDWCERMYDPDGRPEQPEPVCYLCGQPTCGPDVHYDCACREEFIADQMPEIGRAVTTSIRGQS